MRTTWMRASQTLRDWVDPDVAIPLLVAGIALVVVAMVFGG